MIDPLLATVRDIASLAEATIGCAIATEPDSRDTEVLL
jgi:hypothetical protein